MGKAKTKSEPVDPVDLANSIIATLANCDVRPEDAVGALTIVLAMIYAAHPQCTTVTDAIDTWRAFAKGSENMVRRVASNVLDQRYQAGKLK
jgi:hypothetical protein